MALLDFKYYIDFKPLPSSQSFLLEHQDQAPLVTCHDGERYDIWASLDEETQAHGYDYQKYQRRSAVSLELLLPICVLSLDNIKSFAEIFIQELIGQSKLPVVCYLVKKGQGRYLHMIICERAYHENQKESSYGSKGIATAIV